MAVPKWVLCTLNQILGRFEDKLLVLGEGRSGTTWLADMLNFDNSYRLMFEPFQTENFRHVLAHQSEYAIPDAEANGPVSRQIRRVMSGGFISIHANIKFRRFLFHGLLIKDISSQLIVDEITAAAPEMKRVSIFRNPFAVASSKSKTFSWPSRPSAFLSQYNPKRSQLEGHEERIMQVESENDPLLVQFLIWCISTTYLLNSDCLNTFKIVFYENLVTDTENEAERIFFELDMHERYLRGKHQIHAKFEQRTHVTYDKNVIANSRRGQAMWLSEWPARKIDDALEILEEFGLDYLYGKDFFPRIDGRDIARRR